MFVCVLRECAHAVFIFCESAAAVGEEGGGDVCFSTPLHINAATACGAEGSFPRSASSPS